jgi:hypothetical protein
MPGKQVDTRPVYVEKTACAHPKAREKQMRCPDCGGLMRRCCQSIFSFPHRDECDPADR